MRALLALVLGSTACTQLEAIAWPPPDLDSDATQALIALFPGERPGRAESESEMKSVFFGSDVAVLDGAFTLIGGARSDRPIVLAAFDRSPDQLRLPTPCDKCLAPAESCPNCLALAAPIKSWILEPESTSWQRAPAAVADELAHGFIDVEPCLLLRYQLTQGDIGTDTVYLTESTLVGDDSLLMTDGVTLGGPPLRFARYADGEITVEEELINGDPLAPFMVSVTTSSSGRVWALDKRFMIHEREAPGRYRLVADPKGLESAIGNTAAAWLAVEPNGEAFYVVTTTVTQVTPQQARYSYAAYSFVPDGSGLWERVSPPGCEPPVDPKGPRGRRLAWASPGRVLALDLCRTGIVWIERQGQSVRGFVDSPDFLMNGMNPVPVLNESKEGIVLGTFLGEVYVHRRVGRSFTRLSSFTAIPRGVGLLGPIVFLASGNVLQMQHPDVGKACPVAELDGQDPDYLTATSNGVFIRTNPVAGGGIWFLGLDDNATSR